MQYKYSIRRLKRAISQLLQVKFNQIPRSKQNNFIDGEVRAQNIADHFQEIYESLYSQHTLGEDFNKVQQNIQERVHHGLQDDISQSKMHNESNEK